MIQKYKYVGCFIPKEELYKNLAEEPALYRAIAHPHVTVEYMPEQVKEALFGEPVRIKVVGHGIDEYNEGLLVELNTENHELRELLSRIEVPHITLSVSEEGESKNTKFVEVHPSDSFEVNGIYGGFKDDELFLGDKSC